MKPEAQELTHLNMYNPIIDWKKIKRLNDGFL